jgi:hypothetical protein
MLLALACSAGPAVAQDLDRDGLPDALEQALLERFLPTLVLSADECDGRPAAIRPGSVDPVVMARDGTLYGHVTIRATRDQAVEVEVKYFHVWGRDCGRPGHAWDAEHVSALVYAPGLDAPLDAWQAEYWYAAAHEGTVCDASSGATAATLRASRVGPYVYVSRGKHASYLARGQCKWGCGSDLCDSPGEPLTRAGVVNVGEPDAPLNGATWMHSGQLALADKLATDFAPTVRARFDVDPPTTVQALRIHLRPLQAPILGGDTGLDALIAAGRAAADALASSGEAAATAAEATGRAVGTALSRTVKGIAWFLRRR